MAAESMQEAHGALVTHMHGVYGIWVGFGCGMGWVFWDSMQNPAVLQGIISVFVFVRSAARSAAGEIWPGIIFNIGI